MRLQNTIMLVMIMVVPNTPALNAAEKVFDCLVSCLVSCLCCCCKKKEDSTVQKEASTTKEDGLTIRSSSQKIPLPLDAAALKDPHVPDV